MTMRAITGRTGEARDAGKRLLERLGLEFPLLQAGMGGVAGPELAAAVSNAGCGGILGLYKTPAALIPEVISRTRALTRAPFGVNFVPEVVDGLSLLAQVEAVLAAAPAELFFTFFGAPPEPVCARIRNAGHPVLVQVGTEEEAGLAIDLEADGLIVQGIEAGGHHLGRQPVVELLAGLRGRWPAVPLLVAGGIARGADLARLELLGACGALCGTIFVATLEARAHDRYKARVVEGTSEETVVTWSFEIGWPGRPHRVLQNRSVGARGVLPAAFIGTARVYGGVFPVPRFSSAVPTIDTSGAIDEMALYCGTSCDEVHAVRSVAEVIEAFKADYDRARRFGDRGVQSGL